ncbi:aldehyde dehydrogenase family protein [Mobiluncus curtisii]|uniref:Succinate-semialdehyde dehydrogenase [NADP(+)] 2 n=1 Tax=Mobiluncus curtisii TaxID=2051 RepID=A0A2X3DSK9_9ACTO|nr:aldehyde dehydrogenase family protein [Mobiluncus curtisii]SQC02429.1 Putative succinate-semialdehyde dehydrogenase [NADP(+)] 2 [Mobiluncus curtisii]
MLWAKARSLWTGGHALPEISYTAYAPTLLEGVEEGMTLFNHETFGPVVSLYRFHTDEQAIALANDTNYGLNASVWVNLLTPWRWRAGLKRAQ